MNLRKTLVPVVIAMIICIPGLIALTYYFNAQEHPITVQTVTKLKIASPDGSEYTFNKGDVSNEQSLGKDLIEFFIAMNDRAVFVSELPELATDKNRYTVTYTSYNRETAVQYFFTTDAKYAYMVDQNRMVYRINEEDALKFLKSTYSYALYSASAVPVLRVAETEVTPSSMLWQYACFDNEYRTVPVQTTQDVCEVVVRGKMETVFDNIPDYTNVQIYSGNELLYDGLPNGIPSTLFINNANYTVKVESKWFRDETTEESFGEASYQFRAKVLAPAVFYMNQTEIDPGEFVVISAKNIDDPSKIQFSSTPSIPFKPTFINDGKLTCALVPISIELEEIPSSFTFHLAYEGVSQDMQVNIKEKTFKSQSYDISKDLISAHRSISAMNEFTNMLGPILKTCSTTKHFNNELFLSPSGDAAIRTGFGIRRTLSATGETYRHEGVDYVIYNKTHNAVATMKGEVVFVGKLALTGNVVVIDHGFGLHSLYAHLDSISVNKGAIVKQGDVLGICGTTGFTKDRTLHFGLYVQDVPVSPYGVLDFGMRLDNHDEIE